jgi:hypothetical protein
MNVSNEKKFCKNGQGNPGSSLPGLRVKTPQHGAFLLIPCDNVL